jgi:hydroxymethylpyrimidine/phosphomethylpyrimidine kinase
MPTPPVVLSIAGYDPSSGAGVTADIKTAAAFDCFAVTCITALTIQSTQGVFAVEPVLPEIVRETLSRLQEDFDIAAVRIGMLGSGAIADVVAQFLENAQLRNVVLDPVTRSSSDPSGLEILRRRLLPLAYLVTPNGEEAAALVDAAPPAPGSSWESVRPQVRKLADRLHDLGARGVLITGGHLAEPVDFLSLRRANGDLVHEFRGEHLDSRSTHGTGCALATALACLLARGTDPTPAVAEAKEYVRQTIRQAYSLGKGVGPVNHLYRHRTEGGQ